MSDGRIAPSIRWSVSAGGYMFVSAAITAVLLSDLLSILAEVIGLPVAYAMLLLASPALLIGAVVWWAIIEQRNAETYLSGAVFGLFTALLTGLLWTGRFVSVWGMDMLTADIVPMVVGFVLGITSIAGVLVGFPLMYARRRLSTSQSGNQSG